MKALIGVFGMSLMGIVGAARADVVYDFDFSGASNPTNGSLITVTGDIDLKNGSRGLLTPSDILSWTFVTSTGIAQSGTTSVCESDGCGISIAASRLIVSLLPLPVGNSNVPQQGLALGGFLFNWNDDTQGTEGHGIIIPGGEVGPTGVPPATFDIANGTVLATKATVKAPEVDPASAASMVTLLIGLAAVILGRKRTSGFARAA